MKIPSIFDKPFQRWRPPSHCLICNRDVVRNGCVLSQLVRTSYIAPFLWTASGHQQYRVQPETSSWVALNCPVHHTSISRIGAATSLTFSQDPRRDLLQIPTSCNCYHQMLSLVVNHIFQKVSFLYFLNINLWNNRFA